MEPMKCLTKPVAWSQRHQEWREGETLTDCESLFVQDYIAFGGDVDDLGDVSHMKQFMGKGSCIALLQAITCPECRLGWHSLIRKWSPRWETDHERDCAVVNAEALISESLKNLMESLTTTHFGIPDARRSRKMGGK